MDEQLVVATVEVGVLATEEESTAIKDRLVYDGWDYTGTLPEGPNLVQVRVEKRQAVRGTSVAELRAVVAETLKQQGYEVSTLQTRETGFVQTLLAVYTKTDKNGNPRRAWIAYDRVGSVFEVVFYSYGSPYPYAAYTCLGDGLELTPGCFYELRKHPHRTQDK